MKPHNLTRTIESTGSIYRAINRSGQTESVIWIYDYNMSIYGHYSIARSGINIDYIRDHIIIMGIPTSLSGEREDRLLDSNSMMSVNQPVCTH